MTCRDFELIILSIAAKCEAGQQSLDDDVMRQGLVHAEACRRCGPRLAEERALAAGVTAVVANLATREAPPRVEEALLAVFRQKCRGRAATPARSTPAWMAGSTRWLFAAAAALILAVIATFAFFRHQSDHLLRERQILELSGGSSTPESAESFRADSAPGAVALVGDNQAPSRVPNRTRKGHTATAETTTDFFPLTDDEDDDLGSLESAQVVRVELPASALVAAGLPADPETEGQTVRADVVLGQDGLARAIRFVR